MNTEELLKAYSWRYATKSFDTSRKIAADTWTALEETLRLTPSSFGLQLWKFFIVQDPEIRKALRPHSWNQSQITDCSHLVVFTHKTDPSEKDVTTFIEHLAATREAPLESLESYKGMMTGFIADPSRKPLISQWTARQVYIALGSFMSSCAILEIDACPMEGFDKDKYDDILGLKEQGLSAAVLCAPGYRSCDDKYQHAKKVRFPIKDVIQHV